MLPASSTAGAAPRTPPPLSPKRAYQATAMSPLSSMGFSSTRKVLAFGRAGLLPAASVTLREMTLTPVVVNVTFGLASEEVLSSLKDQA